MECPIVKRTEYQLIDIDEEGYCSLMDDSGETRDDLKPIDPDLEKEIRDKVENGEDALVCVLAVSTKNFPKLQSFSVVSITSKFYVNIRHLLSLSGFLKHSFLPML